MTDVRDRIEDQARADGERYDDTAMRVHDAIVSTGMTIERWFAELKRTVAIDFDGVLHPYTGGWQGSTPVDEPPIAGAATFLFRLREAGFRLVVFSTRADHLEGRDGIRLWLHKYHLMDFIDDVTHTKPPAVAYVDDRAVVFSGPMSWPACFDAVLKLAEGPAHGAAR